MEKEATGGRLLIILLLFPKAVDLKLYTRRSSDSFSLLAAFPSYRQWLVV